MLRRGIMCLLRYSIVQRATAAQPFTPMRMFVDRFLRELFPFTRKKATADQSIASSRYTKSAHARQAII